MSNADLLTYFEERPLPWFEDYERVGEAWRHFVQGYLNTANQRRLCDYLDVDDVTDIHAAHYQALPGKVKRRFADWLVDTNEYRFILHDDPHEAPAWMLLEPTTNQLLPSTTPLIHFTDHAEAIQRDGFRYGVADVNKVALTWENNLFDKARRKGSTEPGYNFAYQIKGGAPDLNHRTGYYGQEALLFKSSGLVVFHDGDREQQVIFWGAEANLKGSVVLRQENGHWTAKNKSSASFTGLVKAVRSRAKPVFASPPVPAG